MTRLGQSRFMSFIEIVAATATKMFVAFTVSQLAAHYEVQIQQYIYSDFHWDVGVKSNMLMTLLLTFLSIVQSIGYRRIFNSFHVKQLKNHLRSKDGV